ncbi:hypothetical protein GC177_02665 [bacterium]|nr:hypothetical protein [bacterium]
MALTPLKNVHEQIFGEGPIRVAMLCDPGKDDAMAILQFFAHPERVTLEAIIPSAGNSSIDNSYENALSLCALCRMEDVRVVKGAARPSHKEVQEDSAGAHGLSGFGDVVIDKAAADSHLRHAQRDAEERLQGGADMVVDILKASAGKPVTLVCTGGLTDLAEVLQRLDKQDKGALKNIQAIVMMGGVFNRREAPREPNSPVFDAKGGFIPLGQRHAEFNFFYDPNASKAVFKLAEKHRIPVLLAPLDLTHRITVGKPEEEHLAGAGPKAAMAGKFCGDVGPWDVERFNGEVKQPFHDPATSSMMLHPELFEGQWAKVRVNGATPQIFGWDGLKRWHKEGESFKKPAEDGNVFVLEAARGQDVIRHFIEDMERLELVGRE